MGGGGAEKSITLQSLKPLPFQNRWVANSVRELKSPSPPPHWRRACFLDFKCYCIDLYSIPFNSHFLQHATEAVLTQNMHNMLTKPDAFPNSPYLVFFIRRNYLVQDTLRHIDDILKNCEKSSGQEETILQLQRPLKAFIVTVL